MKVKLSDAFELQMGKTPARNRLDFWNGNHKWIAISDLTNTDKYISATKEHISCQAIEESGIRLVPKGTVVMSFKLSIGKTAITAEDIYTNEAIMAFVDKKVYPIDTSYIYHLFSNMDWSEGSNKAVMGLTLNKATLSDKWIELPELSVQERVAHILDKVSDLIALRKQQLAKLDELVKARFVEMFGDLAAPDCIWKAEKMVDVCVDTDDIKCGPFGTQLSKDEYQSTGIAVWEIPQINSHFATMPTHFLTEEKAQQLDAYSIKSGDIAMSRKGNVGKCAVFPSHFEPGIIHSDVLRIRVDDKQVLPVFLMNQLHFSKAVEHQIELVSSGAIMAGINVTKLKQIFVHIPPIGLQAQFVAFVEQTDKSKLEIQTALTKLETLKKSLMQQYFG